MVDTKTIFFLSQKNPFGSSKARKLTKLGQKSKVRIEENIENPMF